MKDMQTEQLLYWSGMTDTEQNSISFKRRSLFPCVLSGPILTSLWVVCKINVISWKFTVCIATPQYVKTMVCSVVT